MIESINALSSAALASKTLDIGGADAAPAITPAANPAGVSFADFIDSVGTNFSQSLKSAETKSMDGILGKASAREVVEAVMSADQTLQTAMAFRDKIVSAYLEVVKMPI